MNYGDWNYNQSSFPSRYGANNWTKAINPVYTNLFINLVDNYNDASRVSEPISGYADDQVSGYDLATIERRFLKHAYGLSSLSTQLKANKPAGVTDAQIDLLLIYY